MPPPRWPAGRRRAARSGRPARPGPRRAAAVAFTSPDGRTWEVGPPLPGPDHAARTVRECRRRPGRGSDRRGPAVRRWRSPAPPRLLADRRTRSSAAAGPSLGLATTAVGRARGDRILGHEQGRAAAAHLVDDAGEVKPVSLAAIPGAVNRRARANNITAKRQQPGRGGQRERLPATGLSARRRQSPESASPGPRAMRAEPGRGWPEAEPGVAHGAGGWVAWRRAGRGRPSIRSWSLGRPPQPDSRPTGPARSPETRLVHLGLAAGPAGLRIRRPYRLAAAAWSPPPGGRPD